MSEAPPERQIPATVKIRAILAIALPVVLVGLIAVGFIPMLEGGESLWGRVRERFFGGSAPPPQPRWKVDSSQPPDFSRYDEVLKQNNRGDLLAAGMEIEERLRDAGLSDSDRKRLQESLAEIEKKLAALKPPAEERIIESHPGKK
jgi:hypothetical protein